MKLKKAGKKLLDALEEALEDIYICQEEVVETVHNNPGIASIIIFVLIIILNPLFAGIAMVGTITLLTIAALFNSYLDNST